MLRSLSSPNLSKVVVCDECQVKSNEDAVNVGNKVTEMISL